MNVAMNCPRCRSQFPVGAQFCPSCGNDLRAITAAAVRSQQIPAEQVRAPYSAPGPSHAAASAQPTKNSLPWIIAGVLAVALIVGGFFVMNMLKKTDSAATAVLVQKGKAASPVLQQVQKAPPPVMQQSARVPTGMPDDIRRWLEHLENIEKQRGVLAQSGLASFMMLAQTAQFGTDLSGLMSMAKGEMDGEMPTSSTDKVAAESQKVRAQWASLTQQFDSYPPPQSCQSTADTYRHALQETGGMITDILDAVVLAKDDPQKALERLYGMKNASQSINQYGQSADSKVQEVCDAYNTRKWFKISSDFGSNSVLSMFGSR